MNTPAWGWALLAALPGCLAASTLAAAPPAIGLTGTAQVVFTPGDDPGTLLVGLLGKARRQILVQAYSFTHQAIADALIAAKSRGVEVEVLADPVQHANIVTSLVGYLAAQGVKVWLDGEHAAAHNKVILVDPGLPEAVVVTGSFNFTHAAQYRNAENLLILQGSPALTAAYADNWRRHRTHSTPLRVSAP